jgi:hypothetical protein
MSSQANIIVKDKSEKTSILLRFGSDGGPELLREFVSLPFLHAKFIRLLRPSSIAKLQEREMEDVLGKAYFLKKSLMFFDQYGHLFGMSTEYFSQVMMYSFPFQCIPLSKQKHGWGCDEKPIISIDSSDNSKISYALGDVSSYGGAEHYMPKVHAEVAAMNLLLKENLSAEDAESALLKPTKNGFECAHNQLVVHILLNDLDLTFFSPD